MKSITFGLVRRCYQLFKAIKCKDLLAVEEVDLVGHMIQKHKDPLTHTDVVGI